MSLKRESVRHPLGVLHAEPYIRTGKSRRMRTRWMIEEFFKAQKTGCGHEQRQLEIKDTSLTALAMLLPVAYQLLAIRTLADTSAIRPWLAFIRRFR